MSFEKDYYEFERFWNNPEYSHKINIEKIRTIYNMEKNIDDYERLMLQACGEKTMIIKPAPARSLYR